MEFAFGIQLCRENNLGELERLLQTTYEDYNRSVRAAVPVQNNSKSGGPSPPSSQLRSSLHEPAEGTELEEGQCSGIEGGIRSVSPNSERLRSWGSTTARKYDGDQPPSNYEHSAFSVDPSPPSSQLDGPPEESEPIGGAQEVEAQQRATESEGGARSWASRRKTAKTLEGASSSCASIGRFDQGSVFTEPSFSRGSFLPVHGSFLSPVRPGLGHEHQSSLSPPHYESLPDLLGVAGDKS